MVKLLAYLETYRSGDVCERCRWQMKRTKRSGSGQNFAKAKKFWVPQQDITGLTRNFLKSWLFPPLKKPIISGFSSVRKLNILLFFPSVLSKSFWKKCGITYTESCPSGRRCSTRNFTATWSFRPQEIPHL